jgi:hypothetical protein
MDQPTIALGEPARCFVLGGWRGGISGRIAPHVGYYI